MKVQDWIFSIRCVRDDARVLDRCAVVGPARAATVEAALRLSELPEDVRAEIRADATVRKFVDGLLDPEVSGYYAPCPFPASRSWIVCIGSVQEVLS